MARAFVKDGKIVKIVADDYIESELPIEGATFVDNVDILKNHKVINGNVVEVASLGIDPNYLLPNN